METTPVLATTLDLRIFSAIAEELAPSTRRAYKVQLGLLRTFYTEKGWKVFDPDGETFVVQVLEYFSAQVAAGRSSPRLTKPLLRCVGRLVSRTLPTWVCCPVVL